ncbi:MAG: hypothetical protein LJF04_10985 [Gemmatimonadetes bacterium]|nr:hypothetical protein [Gemmatimonadota bacterium]
MNQPVGDETRLSLRGADPRRPRPSYRRFLPLTLAISAAIHLFVLVIYPRVMAHEKIANPVPFRLPIISQGGNAMSAIRIVVVDQGKAERPAEPVKPEQQEPSRITPVAPNLGPTAPPTGLVAPGLSTAERLRPHLTDPRIWAAVDSAFTELTLEQRLQLELSGRIQELGDSMSAAEAAQRALTDWTFTDKNGKKWGVSEGKLHLGDITLPLPFSFGTAVGQRDAVQRADWEWQEIQRGAAAGAVRDSWKDRAKAIRERRDKERAKTKPDTTGVHP